ncbi:MAG: hypothetical protein WA730_06925, partial [Pseudolabrys sp.]
MAARTLCRREPAEDCRTIAVHQHRLGDKPAIGQQSRAVASQQFHDQSLADALAAERQNVD